MQTVMSWVTHAADAKVKNKNNTITFCKDINECHHSIWNHNKNTFKYVWNCRVKVKAYKACRNWPLVSLALLRHSLYLLSSFGRILKTVLLEKIVIVLFRFKSCHSNHGNSCTNTEQYPYNITLLLSGLAEPAVQNYGFTNFDDWYINSSQKVKICFLLDFREECVEFCQLSFISLESPCVSWNCEHWICFILAHLMCDPPIFTVPYLHPKISDCNEWDIFEKVNT